MRLPASFEYIYLREAKTAEKLAEFAGSRLASLCADRGWLFDGRIKSEESVFAKLELGELSSIVDMNDVYATTVVVPTRSEISDAAEAVQTTYPDSEIKLRRRADPRSFKYDDLHIYATLGRTAPGIDSAIRDRTFEIQVRTGLQYSWWRATHDTLYKGNVKDWRLERVASQARGTLDLIDGVLADLPAAAELLDRQPDDADAEFGQIVGWLERWPEEDRPVDRKRFVDTVLAWLSQAGIELEAMGAALESQRGRDLISEEGITPAQVVQVLAADDVGPEALAKEGRRVLVTDELATVAPDFGSLPEDMKVQL
jgi:ppGpp synthetase/RelA/SpoT-type nucleotidyltranferase